MLAQAQLLIGTHHDALLAPRRALLRDDEQPRLFIVEDTPDGPTARRREVQTGLSEGEHIEILDGLQDGDRVIVLGQAGLKDGARVEVVAP
jgi:membrane fusion protein (multidrug efflux system)